MDRIQMQMVIVGERFLVWGNDNTLKFVLELAPLDNTLHMTYDILSYIHITYV